MDIVNDLLLDYNNTKHRTIGMKPKDDTTRNAANLLRNVYGRLRVNRTRKIKFKVGENIYHKRSEKYRSYDIQAHGLSESSDRG